MLLRYSIYSWLLHMFIAHLLGCTPKCQWLPLPKSPAARGHHCGSMSLDPTGHGTGRWNQVRFPGVWGSSYGKNLDYFAKYGQPHFGIIWDSVIYIYIDLSSFGFINPWILEHSVFWQPTGLPFGNITQLGKIMFSRKVSRTSHVEISTTSDLEKMSHCFLRYTLW
jgi:hypothetical protein